MMVTNCILRLSFTVSIYLVKDVIKILTDFDGNPGNSYKSLVKYGIVKDSFFKRRFVIESYNVDILKKLRKGAEETSCMHNVSFGIVFIERKNNV